MKEHNYGSFIGNAPARAKALGHIAHNGDVPCLGCKVCRTFDDLSLNEAFKTIDNIERTNEEYRDRSDLLHNTEKCALAGLIDFDIVKHTVFDYMHAVLLGMMKRFLSNLVTGKDNINCKLSDVNINIINIRLNLIKEYCPIEIARKPEDITKFKSMKATELRYT
ncbi:hypothetical protein HCN44_006013 [Aphidius gifuensis]|uniref:Uncharacterized protein n=1 Tax=Aphidius gifuensis TaxID=684658 RepID=A0A835CVG8_APHGI|nr:hypothetical protein HCN44_006013 [Aphidius gifuensis]